VSRPTLLFLVTEDWYFWSHRLDLARAALAAGFEVTLAARFAAHQQRIEAYGIHCIPLPFVRSMQNPFADLKLAFLITRVVKRLAPALVHTVALKPILLSAGAILCCPTVKFCHAVTGLGYLFISRKFSVRGIRALVTPVFKWLFAHCNCWLIAQNADDLSLLTSRGIASSQRAVLIRGAGVDVQRFAVHPLPMDATPVVVLPARMLRDKGVVEFVAAARLLRERGVAARCVLVGGLDPSNAAALSAPQIADLCRDGAVEWWGQRDDMPDVFALASVVCLPSYREGFPKALLEAAACGRPLIATDVAGCREICRHDETGLLVPPRDVGALANAIAVLLADRPRCIQMGSAARELAVREFSAEIINRETLALYRRLLAPTRIDVALAK
jgi:glycosyltransferase involved in cell wall biosynthesis